jgi:hypothetical protein
MSVLERVSARTRRRTGWILPVAVGSAISAFGPETGAAVSRSDQLWFGGLILCGVVVGVLWQWFSPRNLAERLALPAGALVLAGIFFVVPIAGEVSVRPAYPLWFGGGVLAGLVLTTRWQQLHAED